MTPYKQIKAARLEAIAAGAPLTPKGHCHMCNWPLVPGEMFCSTVCEEDFKVEVAQHANAD